MIKRLIFFGLIFLIPFQLGYHFWLPESFVKSFRIDYLSPTVYLNDIFITLYFLSNLDGLWKFLTAKKFRRFIFVYFLLIAINLYSASFSPVTILAWVRLTVYLLLFLLLKDTPNLAKKAALPFTLSLVIVLLLAFAQFFRQSSLGGIFYYLGERPFSVYVPHVAKLDLGSLNLPLIPSQIVRPYSTFSHPNSLAGYLLVAFLLIPLLTRFIAHRWLVLIVILMTFSKTAFLAFISIFIFETTLIQNILLTVFLTVLPLADWITDIPSWLETSFRERRELLEGFIKVIRDNLITGTGLRQFIPELSQHISPSKLSYQSLQPVHNLFLLGVAELGVLGLALVDYLVVVFFIDLSKRENFRSLLFQFLSLIILTGSLDHYWWTLPQNQLIIVLGLALLINESTDLSLNKRSKK